MDIFERAKRLGVDTEYRDGFGHLRTVEPEVLVRILDALAAAGDGAERMLPRTILVRKNTEQPLRLAAAEGQPLRWDSILRRRPSRSGPANARAVMVARSKVLRASPSASEQ